MSDADATRVEPNESGHGSSATGHSTTAGPFRLVRPLGRGGFGEVHLGEAPDGTRAAVKLLHASWSGDADMRRRFAAELDQARKVSGFCVAAILDADPDAERPWIATEYIDGPTLHQSVTMRGPRAGADLHRLAVSTATALAAIHSAQVIHRDLKPDNILLAADGPRVIDFGIARAAEATSVTASGVVGTVGYMAPEQLEGARLTPAVDIFAWGAIIVFAATGRDAFPGSTQAARITRILTGDPDTGDLDEPLLGIVRSALDKDPARRPDAQTLLTRLVAAPGSAPSAAPAPTAEGQDTREGGTSHHGAPNGDDRDGGHDGRDEDGTAVSPVSPSPGSPTADVGTNSTRVAANPPTAVARPNPTLQYTAMGTPGAAEPAGPAPAPGVGGAPGTPGTPSAGPGAAGSGPAAAMYGAPAVAPPGGYATDPPGGHATDATPTGPGPRTGGVPPYHFTGVKFTDPHALAAAMQRNWSAAVQVFSDTTELAALGAWLIDDVGDTTVDRSIFRRRPDDVNQAVSWFIAQLRPDLPPVFRGHDTTIAGLAQMFSDPGLIITNNPVAGEMTLLARPQVLRTMSRHDHADQRNLQRLAHDLEVAERAGTALLRRLVNELAGWKPVRPEVDPALVLTFLLHPERAGRPMFPENPQATKLAATLWEAVAPTEPGSDTPPPAQTPEAIGRAAAIYGALPAVANLGREQREGEESFETAQEELSRIQKKLTVHLKLRKINTMCGFGVLLGFMILPILFFWLTLADVDGATFVGVAALILGVSSLVAYAVSRVVDRVRNGPAAKMLEKRVRADHLSARMAQLSPFLAAVRNDLQNTERICREIGSGRG